MRSRQQPSIILSLIALACAPLAAQINGVPASVTSPGFGGRAINGTPASVTSLGPHGYGPQQRDPFFSIARPIGEGQHRHRRDNFVPFYYAVPVPYAVDNSGEQQGNDYDPDEQGGPTVFDRRGQGERSYIPPVNSAPATERAEAPAEPEPPATPTVLVFKDGHQLEIENYAIQGQTLFDLTSGHHRRVSLADLDLEATRQQNEDRGIVFAVPQPN